MTRTPLSRSKGQGHQAALVTAAFTRQAAAAVTVETYSPWEPTATLRSGAVGSAARGASASRGRRGAGHIVAAPAQLVSAVFDVFMSLLYLVLKLQFFIFIIAVLLPAGCHGNLTVLNLLSASVTKNQHFRPCRKNYVLDRQMVDTF